MIDVSKLSSEDLIDANNLAETLWRLMHNQRPAMIAHTLALLVYETMATVRRNAIRRQATVGNVTSLAGATALEVVPTAAGIEELLAAVGAEARKIRAECAEMCGEEDDEEEWEDTP
jgi:hypothetical protein